MRQELLDYIKGLNLTSIAVSNDLPYEDGGVPLHLKNVRTLYVDRPQTVSDPFIQTLNSITISNETTTISVFLALDAKQVIANYDSIVSSIKAGKDITTIQGINRRECDVVTEYVNDILVTTFEFRFIRIT